MNVEKNDNLKHEIIINLCKKEIIKKNEDKINELSKSLKLKGFRVGCIPKNIINMRFGKDINQENTDKLLNIKFIEYIKLHNLEVIEKPHVIKIKDDIDIICFKLEFETLPKIIINLNNIKINKYKTEITELNVTNEIDRLRLKHASWENIYTQSKYNDLLIVDLYKKTNDKIQYIIKKEEIILDDNPHYIQNIKTHLIDKSINIEYSFVMKNNNLSILDSNNEYNVYILIHNIKRKCPAIINDFFMKKIGFPGQNYNNLNNIVRDKLVIVSNYLSEKIMRSDILEALLNTHKFDIPEAFTRKEGKNSSIRHIKMQLILSKIKQKFNINVSQTEIHNHINLLYKNNKSKVINNNEYINNIENDLYMTKIMKILEEKIDIKETIISLDNLIKLGDIK